MDPKLSLIEEVITGMIDDTWSKFCVTCAKRDQFADYNENYRSDERVAEMTQIASGYLSTISTLLEVRRKIDAVIYEL